MEEVFDSLFSCNGIITPQVCLLQVLLAPEEVSPEIVLADAIPSLVSAPDPESCLNCHTLRKKIKWHNVQYSFKTSSGCGMMHMSHSWHTLPLPSIKVLLIFIGPI